MRRSALFAAALIALVFALSAAPAAVAQVTGLYYQEVEKDGRVYVFNTPERYKLWQDSGDMGQAITLPGAGPNGETVVGENETAIDLYNYKHNLPAYDRPTPKPTPPAAFPATKIGGRVFADVTSKQNKDEGTGTKSADSGVGVDVKRFYFTVTHDFDATWSAQFQSDIGDQGARRYDVFVKKAYVQAKLSPAMTFRLGSADTPWVPYVEGQYGFRYFEQVVVDHLSFGTSADWGLHMLGTSGMFGYQFSVINGRGYSNPSRSKTVDFEGRVNVEPIKGLTLAVGGYSGKRGLETDTAPAKHTAERLDGLISFVNPNFRLGAEYFSADNWNTVTSVASDSSDGYSLWAGFTPTGSQFTGTVRYDSVNPSKDLKPKLEETYYNLGLQWRFNKAYAGLLGYKHQEVEGGTFSTGNGTIGSNVPGKKGKYDEVGVWVLYDF
jgi:hypothetical protein